MTLENRTETIIAAAKAQVARNLADRKTQRLQAARTHMERIEAKKREGEKIQFTLSAETRAKAEKACPHIYGTSLTQHLRDICKAIADTPQGHIPKAERAARKSGYTFPHEEDRRTEEELSHIVKDMDSQFPHGYTMDDLISLYEVLPNDRSTTTLFGRIMKNLGYTKRRTYVPATEDAPAKLGWIYRKEEPWNP